MRAYVSKDAQKYGGDMSYEGKYLLDPKYMTKRDLQHYYRYYNMTKNRSQFKKIVIIIFCVCIFSYVFVDYNLRTKLMRLRDRFDFIPRIDAEYNISQAYFVDTPGCRMPFFDVTDDNIVQFMNKPQSYHCRKPLTSTSDNDTVLLLNMNEAELMDYYNVSDLAAVRCRYAQIQRKNEWHNVYLPEVTFKLNFDGAIRLPSDMEFMRVECFERERRFYKDYHFFAITKNDLIKETTPPQPSKVSSTMQHKNYERVSFNETLPHDRYRDRINNSDDGNAAAAERLSVMVLGIDSVSHLNFLRQMRRTANYIRRKLSHIEFWGFNKVGDNTYPNLVPLLSGLDETELNISCLAPLAKPNYDGCSFIWKRFKEAGFKTAYAEDVAWLALFNFCRPGFKKQPTDYYLRPIMLEMERNIAYKVDVNVKLCMGGRRTADVVLEFIRKLVPRLKAEHFFSFFWTVTLTHDSFNMPTLLDADIAKLLATFDATGIFNRTLIFLMSDHGLRWGSFRKTYQGLMEERQPLLMALYPAWLKEAYPLAISNMAENAKRLITPYDLHATMLDLLDLSRNLREKNIAERTAELLDPDNTLPRGISLFLPIPQQRTCEHAGIAAHWCTCHQREEFATNDGRVQRAARYTVHLINARLKSATQCRTLYLNSILQAFIAAPHHKIVKNMTDDYAVDITLRLQTKPGLGIFESTVRMSSYSTALTGTISRINLYGSQSYCTNDYTLKMFCYCHR